jgi:hypothetical protein
MRNIGCRDWVVGGVATLLIGTTVAAQGDGTASARRGSWTAPLQAVERALAAREVGEAEQAWREAYVAAVGSWRWEGPLDVGDAALRIGAVTGLHQAAAARARNLYLTALFRARQQSALDGVLQTAEAFARLGDRDNVAQCLRMAEALASDAHDSEAAGRVRAFAARLADRPLATGEVGR